MAWSRDEGKKKFPNPNPFSSYPYVSQKKTNKNRIIDMFMSSLSMKTQHYAGHTCLTDLGTLLWRVEAKTGLMSFGS